MKFKKVKILLSVLAFTPLCLLAACGNNDSNPTTTEPTTPVQTTSNQGDEDSNVLEFLNKGQIRVELYDMDVNVSYGNQALDQTVNTTTLVANAGITFSRNTTENDVYCTVVVAEKVGVGQTNALLTKVYGQTEGSSLTEFQGILSSEFKDYDRVFISIAKGTEFKWTKTLSTKLNDKIESFVNSLRN